MQSCPPNAWLFKKFYLDLSGQLAYLETTKTKDIFPKTCQERYLVVDQTYYQVSQNELCHEAQHGTILLGHPVCFKIILYCDCDNAMQCLCFSKRPLQIIAHYDLTI